MKSHDTSAVMGPLPTDWAWLEAISGPLDVDFIEAATEQPPLQERSALDKTFD